MLSRWNMPNTLSNTFKTFTAEIGENPDEFKVGDLLFIKSTYRHCVSEVKSMEEERTSIWKWSTRAYSHYVIWSHPTKANPVLCTSLITVGDRYINFGRITIRKFRKKYPEYFV